MSDELLEPTQASKKYVGGTLNLTGKTVLIVEDYEPSRDMIAEYLDLVNCECDTAENGKIAFEKFKRRDYDLILMDCNMPEWDGMKATRAIRKLEKGRQVRILAMTANDQAKDIEDCLAAGMNEIMAKPVNRTTLYAKLEHWLYAEANRQKSGEETSRRPSPKTHITFKHSVVSMGPIDFQSLVRELEDRETAHNMVDGFLKILPQQFRKIEESIDADNAEIVNREAHSIKGGAANIFAENLQNVASKLEKATEGRLGEDAIAIFQLLKDAAEKLQCYYREKFHPARLG